jgi:hypothetical protein
MEDPTLVAGCPAELCVFCRTILTAINDSGAFGGGGNPFMFKVY